MVEESSLKLGEDEKRILNEGFQNCDTLRGLKYIQSNLDLFEEQGFDISEYENRYLNALEEFVCLNSYEVPYPVLGSENN